MVERFPIRYFLNPKITLDISFRPCIGGLSCIGGGSEEACLSLHNQTWVSKCMGSPPLIWLREFT